MTSYRLPLDALTFFLADVRGGLGSYVSVYLLTEGRWSAAQIGAVLTVSGLVGITMHAPIGAVIDTTRAKRGLIVAGVVLLSAIAIAIERRPTGPVVLVCDVGMAVLGAVFAPTVAAITLGLVSRHELAPRLGRNAACDRAGNVFIAAVAGLAGWRFGQRSVFWLAPLFGALCIAAVLSIDRDAIDHERARGGDVRHRHRPDSWWSLLVGHEPLLVLAGTAALFHFANASMLPLVGQELALAHPGLETPLLSACLLVAQLVTIPVAILIGARADRWGRKALLAAACVALVLRGLVFGAFGATPWALAGQVLDGVGGGIFDTLLPLILADVVGGTGRYNVSRGLIGTVQGIGGSLSNVAAGTLVTTAGYRATFAALAAVAAAALLLVVVAMPETRRDEDDASPEGPRS